MITTPRRTLRGEKGGNKHSIKALNCNDDDDGEAIKNSGGSTNLFGELGNQVIVRV